MRAIPLSLSAMMLVASMPATAADPAPEIERAAVAPQQTGVMHALRTIPEACARLQGEFAADPAQPYRFAVVRISAGCQPRARLIDADKAKPSAGDGWILNDRIRVPSAGCPSQAALVDVWRRPGTSGSPALDAQGKARIYLGDSRRKAQAGKLAAIPAYAVSMRIEGKRCGT